MPRTGFLISNLMLVYFFEYVIITSFADTIARKVKITHDSLIDIHDLERKNFYVSAFYVILNVCYQIGVFISRSSLRFVKVKRIDVLTTL